MDLSSPYGLMPWTIKDAAESIRAAVKEQRQRQGARLRDLRKRRGWNQEDAAHAVSVAVKTWQNWESGRTNPYDANWRKIGEVFEVDPVDIIGAPPSPLGLGPNGGAVDPAQLDRIESKLDRLLALFEGTGDDAGEDAVEVIRRAGRKTVERLVELAGTEPQAQPAPPRRRRAAS